ncbi:hypothetical protein M9H77_11271 [Catharanthus roseus]|uniref:Uncharacterized protein n=2 Tax=Catharanthus roseus TaxID=4058 RepID=A0ACB9ZZG7_CATRO|nr:hypothetical protein M9H77_30304 [Catharanthus roseus]KAI5670907.1 hypothetical protein M9H77_11271 [Catharanthus roseus]
MKENSIVQKVVFHWIEEEEMEGDKNESSSLEVTRGCNIRVLDGECNEEDFNEDVDEYELCIEKEGRNYPIERDNSIKGDENGTKRRVYKQRDGVRRRYVDTGEGCNSGVGVEDILCTDDLSVDDVMKITFDSVEDADAFYMMYGKCVGFSVRKGDLMIDKKGITMYRKWHCNK